MAAWNPKANEVFVQAVELSSTDERRALLDRECGSDAGLREQVEKLLKAHDAANSFLQLQQPASGSAPTEVTSKPASDVIGSRIGPYKLLQEIGEGGMGTVFMAEQTEPVKRMVALKVIKPGMDTAQVVARFEAERQALALMDHPNIAKVLDAGATDAGRPYFVMELVKGVPITCYCDEHLLTPRQRVELFVPVCQAIQHAHQKGIIHRDLKPSNVLIASYDGRPVPKVIDFGVAKAMGQQLTERTMFTGFGGIVGTLEYMSPEQAEFNALDVDTRSDIYSLGVLLYELLTGSTPLTKLQLKQAAITEVLRLIREQEPPKPSTRLSESRESLASLSAQRKLDPMKLTKEVSGELDWIVMKALEKDRTRRYETVAGLARDVQRYLCDEQVEACPPSVGYRMRKFTRRHSKSLTTAACFVLIFVISFAAVAWQAYRASMAEQRAVIEAQIAHQAREREAKERAAAQALALSEAQAAKSAAAALIEADEQRKKAIDEKQRAEQAREQATDSLARSQFDQAHAVRLAGLPGRRWLALDLLKQAEALRARRRGEADAATADGTALPSQAELRTEAVAALMLKDGRIARIQNGFTHSVSPDGQYAASASLSPGLQGGLTILDLQTGEVARRWQGKQAQSLSSTLLALGPGAEQLAVVSLDMRQIGVWDLKELKLLRTLTWPAASANAHGPIRQLTFSPDGLLLAGVVPGKPGEVIISLWRQGSPEGEALATVRRVPLVSLAFSPDSRFLAFASQVKQATIWNVAEGRAEHVIELPLFTEGAVGFDPSGQRLAIHGRVQEAMGLPSRLLLWNIAENREAARLDTGGIVSGTPISFAPDGQRVAVSGANRIITVLDLPTAGEPEGLPVRVNHRLHPQMLAWSARGQLLSGGLDGLKFWEFVSPDASGSLQLKTERKASHAISRLAFSPDGKLLAAEAWPGPEVALVDRMTGQQVRSLRATLEVGNINLRFSPDGCQLLRFGQGGLRIWDVSSGEEQQRPADQPAFNVVSSVGIRPDGRLLATHSPLGNACQILDVIAGKAVWQPQQRSLGSTALVSPDGRFAVAYEAFAVGRAERPIQVWSLEYNRERFTIPSPAGNSFQSQVEISPDSRWIAALHFGGDVAKSFPRGTSDARYVQESLAGQADLVIAPSAFAFGQSFTSMIHPDQPWFGEVCSAETGTRHCQIDGPINVENQAFSPDGRYLAVGMRGGLVRLWDIPAAKELFDWQRPSNSGEIQPIPRQLAFTADSTALAVPDLASPALHLLNLTLLNQQLAEVSLGW